MAYRVADATGNWTAAGTWKGADTTSFLDSQANTVSLTASFVSSSAFSPGAITLAGICVKVATVAQQAAATVSIRLAQAGVAVAGTTVTINIADLPTSLAAGANTFRGCSVGWVYFKFASPVTLLAATAYTLQATCSTVNRVSLFRDATAANYARLLVTTTTGAPAAGDSMFVLGAHTGVGAITAIAVNMNNTTTDDYGGTSTVLASLGVGHSGSLTYDTSGAATYRLRLSGVFQEWIGGTFRIGTAAGPIPRAGMAILEFDCAADGDFGAFLWSTHSLYGESRTSGKTAVVTRLTADAAIAATTLNVVDDTGWLNGDRVLVGSTTRVSTETEVRTLSGGAGASSMAISAGLTNAHSGTVGSRAEVALIDRNVVIRAVTAAATFYWIDRDPSSNPDIGWVLWENHGGTASIDFEIGAPSLTYPRTYQSCCWYGYERSLVGATAATTAPINFIDCVAYTTVTAIQFGIFVTPVTVTRGAYFGAAATQPGGFDVNAGTFTAADALFCGAGISMGTATADRISVAIDRCEFHSSPSGVKSLSIAASRMAVVRARNTRFWRNAAAGSGASSLQFNLSSAFGANVTIENCQFIGNACATGCGTGGLGGPANVRYINCDFECESGFTATAHAIYSTTIQAWVEFHRCRFSQAGPVASSADISANGSPMTIGGIGGFGFYNTLFGAATPFSTSFRPVSGGGSGVYWGDARFSFMREGGITGAHTSQFGNGRIDYQAVIFHSAAPSEEMRPTAASTFWPLGSARVHKPVASGQSVTFSVWLRKTAGYDGTAPRVRVEANGNSGWDDTEVAMAGGADTWEEITVTVGPATDDGVAVALIECDGTVGSVYVDDWSATTA